MTRVKGKNTGPCSANLKAIMMILLNGKNSSTLWRQVGCNSYYSEAIVNIS